MRVVEWSAESLLNDINLAIFRVLRRRHTVKEIQLTPAEHALLRNGTIVHLGLPAGYNSLFGYPVRIVEGA